jgi:hydroxyethylthiazole kinase-like sugar kinase family protein
MGLDDVVYGMVRSNLLAQDPLPNLNKTYSTLVQEERVRTVVRGKEQQSEVMSFAVQAVKSRGKIDEKEKNDRCNHCNRTGHDVNNCFEVIGYPEWWSDRPRRTGRGSANGKGIQQGSSVSKGRGRFIKANTAHALVNKSNLSLEGEQSEVAGLSDEQWKTLLHLLNNATTSSTEKLSGMQWIIDTGTSRHMTGRLDCLSDMKNIAHCQVGLPNGNQIAAVKEGTSVLS